MNVKRILLMGCLLLAFVLLSGGCEGCADECKKCNDAISHMGGKIMAQGCDPNTMEKAYDRIRDDCDFPNAAVGVLAETCEVERSGNGTIVEPGCQLPGLELQSAGISIGVGIDLEIHEGNPVDLEVIVPRATFKYEFPPEERNQQIFMLSLDEVVSEGDMFEIVL